MPTSGQNSLNIKYISFQIIIEINREQIERFGGLYFPDVDNLLNEDSLIYILDAIQYPICGQELFPTIFEKAAALGHQIICRHVFYDGNKRTAFDVVRLFLFVNNYYLRLDKEGIKKALDIANDKVVIDDFAKWLEEKAILMQWPEETSSKQF